MPSVWTSLATSESGLKKLRSMETCIAPMRTRRSRTSFRERNAVSSLSDTSKAPIGIQLRFPHIRQTSKNWTFSFARCFDTAQMFAQMKSKDTWWQTRNGNQQMPHG
jgi:hypothetical protein